MVPAAKAQLPANRPFNLLLAGVGGQETRAGRRSPSGVGESLPTYGTIRRRIGVISQDGTHRSND